MRKSILLLNVNCCLDDVEDVTFDWMEQETPILRKQRHKEGKEKDQAVTKTSGPQRAGMWGVSQVFYPL